MQDKLDIETTARQGTAASPSAAASGPQQPTTPSDHVRSPDNLDIEMTEARPRAPIPSLHLGSAVPELVASEAQSNLVPGTILDGKFAIGKLLGRGGIGIVYKATERDTQVEFAVKVLSPELVLDPESRADLKKEVARAQVLSHQNVLKVNYLAETSSLTYIVMECVDGETLEERRVRSGGAIPLDEFRAIAPQILAALEYLHGKGLVHCDVKPQNIMVTLGGEVKIADFGIARTIKEQLARVNSQQVPIGTLAFMSPEQVRGNALCDRRTDVYSAGIMFHRLLTGSFPFACDDRERVIAWHIDEDHIGQSTGYPHFDAIIRKMLAVVPDKRYRSCGEVLADLAQTWDATDATPAEENSEPATEAEVTLQVTDAWRAQYLKPYDDAVAALFAGVTLTPQSTHGASAVNFIVPLFCGTQRAAVESVISESNKANLPLLNLECVECSIDHDRQTESDDVLYHVRYILRAWTMFVEDANQIVRQVKAVFDGRNGRIVYPKARQPFHLELGCIGNNLYMGSPQVVKYEFELSLRAKLTSGEGVFDPISGRVLAKTVDLEDVLVEPAAFDAQFVSMRGIYYGVYTSTGRLSLDRGGHRIDVYYSQIPKEQQQVVLRESEAEGHPIIVEGILNCSRDPEMTATGFAFVEPPAGESAQQVDLEDLLAEPDTYDGAYVLLEGEYSHLYTRDSSFNLSQGDHDIWVFYSRLPKEQRRKIMRESEAEGRAVGVKGIVVCYRNKVRLSATRFVFCDEEDISESEDSARVATTSSTAARATIQSIWVNYRTPFVLSVGGQAKGVEVRLSLCVHNMKGGVGYVAAYFSFLNGNPLKSFNSAFAAPDGQLCVGERIELPYENTEWKDFVLFMPEHEIKLQAGVQHRCQVRVCVFRQSTSGQWEQMTVSHQIPFNYPPTP